MCELCCMECCFMSFFSVSVSSLSVKHWTVASVRSRESPSDQQQHFPQLNQQEAFIVMTVHGHFFTANTSPLVLKYVECQSSNHCSGSSHCGPCSSLSILALKSSNPCVPAQSSFRAPNLRGPLAALRSARLASSSFLLSSRFFLDSSALLRPGRQ